MTTDFDWGNFLELAREMASPDGVARWKNARLRSAISRAYYAAFHRARDYMLKQNDYPPRGNMSSHEQVWRYYQDATELTRKKIGLDLQRLLDDRNSADYEPRYLGSLSKAAESGVTMAADIVSKVTALDRPKRAQNK
jgi:uncharacterized protein (UPF0332 family)